MENHSIPTDGPETALARIVRKLKLPYSRTFVARNVASHKQPSSLLALVEVAEQLGVKTKPAEIEAAAFEELDLPMLVHFKGADAGGFGVLEGMNADSFEVWDSVRGLRPIPRDVFLEHWSGVVAIVERTNERTLEEKGYLRHRVADAVFSGWDPPEVVRGPLAFALRSMLGLLIAALLVLSTLSLPSSDRVPAAVLALLSILGLAITVVTAISIGSESGLSERVCKRGKFVDCHSVLASRYSRIFGISFADIGIAFFGSSLLLIAAGSVTGSAGIWWVLAVLFAGSLPFSIALIGAQIGMRQLCTLCLGVHVTNFSAAAVLCLWLRPPVPSFRDGAAGLVLLTLFFFVVLFFVIPLFKKHQGLVVLAGMQRRISSSPFASLAELLTERPTGVEARSCGLPVSESDPARHDLLVLAHPSCNKCDLALQELRVLTQEGLVNSYLGLTPKDPDEADRRACASILAAGLALGPQRLFDLYPVAKENLAALLSGDAVSIMNDIVKSPTGLEAQLQITTELVGNAEALADAHAEGTPAVFFDGRLYRGPLTHLAFLLQRHQELLRPLSGSETPQQVSS
jgi:uncharacterized membrane protein